MTTKFPWRHVARSLLRTDDTSSKKFLGRDTRRFPNVFTRVTQCCQPKWWNSWPTQEQRHPHTSSSTRAWADSCAVFALICGLHTAPQGHDLSLLKNLRRQHAACTAQKLANRSPCRLHCSPELTVQTGLDCRVPAPLAWKILHPGATVLYRFRQHRR